MPIGYTKLKSGEWGIRGGGEPPAPGSRVTVTKRDGSENSETVDAVLWSGEDKRSGGVAWMATIEREGKKPQQSQPQQPKPEGWQPAPEPKPFSDPGFDDRTPF